MKGDQYMKKCIRQAASPLRDGGLDVAPEAIKNVKKCCYGGKWLCRRVRPVALAGKFPEARDQAEADAVGATGRTAEALTVGPGDAEIRAAYGHGGFVAEIGCAGS